jgi:two-component system response regulator ResD
MPRDVGRSARAMIADDDGLTRMLVKVLLEREHFDVIEAANGREAIELAASARPDVMLMDLYMPEMDGCEAIQALRRNRSFASIPIIVLTAEANPGIERRVFDMGADGYMLKPFEPEDLISRVNAVFRRLNVAAA